jgi:hypothetical protein
MAKRAVNIVFAMRHALRVTTARRRHFVRSIMRFA